MGGKNKGKGRWLVKRMGILLLAVCLLLGGCGKKPPAETTAPVAPARTTAPTLSRETVLKNRMGSYRETVENFAYEHRFPDGSAVPADSAFGSMDGNFFAVADVDGDGEKELVISFTAGPMASMALYVCGFEENTGKVTVLLTEFPSVSFYPGGFLEAQLSHNHGLAGDSFWPYTLYAREGGSYESIAFVDAWDVSLARVDGTGKPFPADIDADGDGIVYLVTRDGETKTLDGKDYASWRSSILGQGEPIPVSYYAVTRDNIRQVFNDS